MNLWHSEEYILWCTNSPDPPPKQNKTEQCSWNWALDTTLTVILDHIPDILKYPRCLCMLVDIMRDLHETWILRDQWLKGRQDGINISNCCGYFCSDNFIRLFGSSKIAEDALERKAGVNYENIHPSMTINLFWYIERIMSLLSSEQKVNKQ